MKDSRLRFSRRAALAAALLGGAVALFVALPSRGQQEPSNPQAVPSVRVAAPATAVRADTTAVNLDFTLPAGIKLARNPRLRVLNDKDELWELLPTFVVRLSPTGSGHRPLNTHTYSPGTYRVRAEIDVLLPTGKEDSVGHTWERLAGRTGGTIAGLATATAADGATLVFAATAIGLHRSADAGRTWTAASVGMLYGF